MKLCHKICAAARGNALPEYCRNRTGRAPHRPKQGRTRFMKDKVYKADAVKGGAAGVKGMLSAQVL
jgi:hypothetical protein